MALGIELRALGILPLATASTLSEPLAQRKIHSVETALESLSSFREDQFLNVPAHPALSVCVICVHESEMPDVGGSGLGHGLHEKKNCFFE